MQKIVASKLWVAFLFLAAMAAPLSVWGQATGDKVVVGNWLGCSFCPVSGAL